MSWAVNRNTTRKEDIANCLFGLFDVNMSLLYEEGDRAFRRLQNEIIKTSFDDSVFAWSPWDSISKSVDFEALERQDSGDTGRSSKPFMPPLAPSPRSFSCLKHKDLPAAPAMRAGKT